MRIFNFLKTFIQDLILCICVLPNVCIAQVGSDAPGEQKRVFDPVNWSYRQL